MAAESGDDVTAFYGDPARQRTVSIQLNDFMKHFQQSCRGETAVAEYLGSGLLLFGSQMPVWRRTAQDPSVYTDELLDFIRMYVAPKPFMKACLLQR